MRKLFTSESVTEGHPDKICDQISDAVLDAILKEDPEARVACETVATTGQVFVMGQITTTAYVNINEIARDVVREIGYTRGKFGFDADNLSVITAIEPQSPDIAMGVDEKESHEQGAGDQGMVYGFASNETKEYMPLGAVLAHKLAKQLTKARKDGTISELRPDGKTQVTIEYENDKIKRIDTILVSSQHAESITVDELKKRIIKEVIMPIIPKELIDDKTKILVNPTGRFVIGGPKGDTGLTGRKIIVDTYCGYAKHGGGAFSGKDPSKVDRTGAYAARYVAKNIVAAELASKCEVQIAYAIGIAKPVSISVDTFNTSKLSDEELAKIIETEFDLRPKAIIDYFKLKRPIYQQTATYGHFGRDDLDLPWEKLDKVNNLRKYKKES